MSAYQEKVMLPADLRDYAAPTFWRLHGEKVYAAVFCALVAWHVENEITGQGSSTVEQSLYKGQVAGASPAPTTFDCPRLRSGQWLRSAIWQQGDRTLAGWECIYGHAATVRFAP